MKVGMRKPSIKKSVKARTTGAIKRKAKKSINPLYGKSGMGYVKNPKKAAKDKIYHKTTFGLNDAVSYGVKELKNDDVSYCADEELNNNVKHTRIQTEKEIKIILKLSKYALLPMSILLILISIVTKDWIFIIIGIVLLIYSIYMTKDYKNKLKEINK